MGGPFPPVFIGSPNGSGIGGQSHADLKVRDTWVSEGRAVIRNGPVCLAKAL